MAKVLVVTDYNGILHITPTGNKDFYKSINARVKDKQFGLHEMDEAAAYKHVEDNNGIDPKFKTPQQASKIIEDKDAEIKALREALAAAKSANPELTKERAILKDLSTTATSDSPYSQKAADQIKDVDQLQSSAADAEKQKGEFIAPPPPSKPAITNPALVVDTANEPAKSQEAKAKADVPKK